ncbi:hypothetical protein VE04_00591 [Pseudogymnoascus sp. 24MN13]|nr:hypothetical protein VE04_00591 [Pseudogymnoascus sp. 24MN13]
MQRHHIAGSTESFQTAHNPPSSPNSQRPLSQNTLIGSDRLGSITLSMPGEPSILIREDGFIAFENNPAHLDPSSPIRSIRCSMPGVPPRLIREDGSVILENEPTSSGPSTPIPSSPRLRPRTPSLSGSDFSDTSSVYYNRRPYNYTPPRGYISNVLYGITLFTTNILVFLPLLVEDIPMGFQLIMTGTTIFALASYGMLIGWEVRPDGEPGWYEEWRY